MRETDREHRLIEHALSVMDLLRRNRLDLEQFVAGAIQPELPLEPQEEHLAREAIAFMDEMPAAFSSTAPAGTRRSSTPTGACCACSSARTWSSSGR